MTLQFMSKRSSTEPAPASPLQFQLETARQVQSRMLRPSSPAMTTLEYDGRCYPAADIGGDYYDFLSPRPGYLGLAVGDVSGKGIAAALMLASLQSSLRTLYAAGLGDMESALVAANELFRRGTASRHYASLFLAEFDDASRRLRYVNCGHVAPLVLRRDGQVVRLEPTTTVLGLFADWTPVVAAIDLDPGDTLVAVSDGISEAANAMDVEFGRRLFVDVARRHRSLPVAVLLKKLLTACREFAAREPEDDMTLVVARATSHPAEAASESHRQALMERSRVA